MHHTFKQRGLPAVLLTLVLCLGVLSGCGSAEKEQTPAGEAPAESTPAEEPPAPTAAVLPDTFPMEFDFSSGAGAWGTALTLERDGTFSGSYHDSEMGESGDGYPKGTVYCAVFSGAFGDIRQVDDHTYALTLEEVTPQETPGTISVEEDIRYVAAEPYGLEEGKDFLLYTPETPTKGLDEEFLSWWPGRYPAEEQTGTLDCWGLWNQETGYGFFTYD